jgi:signal transduction histidine kinase
MNPDACELGAAGGLGARRIRSAVLRLALVYVAAFIVSALLFTIGAAQIVQAKNDERVRALVTADMDAILDKIGPGAEEERVGAATAIVLARSARADDPRLYGVRDGAGTLIGRVTPDTRLTPVGDGWFKVSASDGPVFGLARRVPLGVSSELIVGRRFEELSAAADVAEVGAGALALAALSAFVVGPWASRRILRRVTAVNQACDRVRTGDLSARAPYAETNDEFGALARHVNAMLERIDSLVLGLRDVSNRVAHDLRTPMARLKNDLQAVARAETLEEARALAGAAVAETDEILQTFEALLDIAEVEAGSDAGLKPMALDVAAEDAVNLYQAVAEHRGVVLRFHRQPAPMLGERSLVVRLAANLIDNAIKFSPPGSDIDVTVRREGGDCHFEIRDRGPGVPPAERETVLLRFTRGSSVGSAPGHGLGLALVSAVAKRHGAKVRLEDAGPGLRVRVAFKAFEA